MKYPLDIYRVRASATDFTAGGPAAFPVPDASDMPLPAAPCVPDTSSRTGPAACCTVLDRGNVHGFRADWRMR